MIQKSHREPTREGMVPWLARDDIAFARTGHFDDAAATATAWSAGDVRVSRLGRGDSPYGHPDDLPDLPKGRVPPQLRPCAHRRSGDLSRSPATYARASMWPALTLKRVPTRLATNRAGDGTGRDETSIATVLFGNRVTRNLMTRGIREARRRNTGPAT